MPQRNAQFIDAGRSGARNSGAAWRSGSWALFAALVVAALAPSAAPGQVIDWVAATGSWNTATNWSPQNVPNAAGESARFPLAGGTFTTTVNVSPTLDAVTVLNPTATLNLGSQTLTMLLDPGLSNAGIVSANSGTGTLAGSIVNNSGGIIRTIGGANLHISGPTVANDGQFLVNSNGSSSNSTLYLNMPVEFSGSGEILMNAATQTIDANLDGAVDATLTNGASHTIRGTGTVSAAIDNLGRIAGGGSSYGLTLDGSTKTNHGIIETLSSGLLIISTGIDQTPDGIIRASDGTVRLIGSSVITGGALEASGTGTIFCYASTPHLVDVTNEAPLDILGGVSVVAEGSTFTNNGAVRVNSNNTSGNAYLSLADGITLDGAGEILMRTAGDLGDANITAGATAWSTHGASHTIHGSGTIDGSMNNLGTIRADVSATRLYLSMPGLVNDGLLSATSGGILDIVCDSVMQSAGGRILADAATARLTGPASVRGGRIETTSGGQIQSYSGTITVTDIHNGGEWHLRSGSSTDLRGASIVNDGTIFVNETTSGNTYLRAQEPVLLSGTGAVVLQAASSTDDAIFSSATGVDFTQGAGHTIRGTGRLSAGMVNDGTVLGDLGGVGIVLSGADKTNRGLFRAAPGGKLTIESTTITQEGAGRIVADDGQVLLSAASVQGGTLESSGTGYLRSSNTCTLRNLANRGEVRIAPGYVLQMDGDSLRNDGVIRVNDLGTSGNTYLRAQQNMVLTGSGEIVLRTGGSVADANISTASGAVLTVAQDQEIRGEGLVGANLLNRGTITADVAGRSLNLGVDGQTNMSTMRAIAGGVLRVYSGTVVNQALIEATDTSRVSVYVGTLDNRAEVIAHDGATFQVEGGTFANNAVARAFGGGRIFQSGGTINNYGTLRVEAQGEIRIDQTIAFRNLGIVEATDDGLFWSDRWADHFSAGTLTGGSWRAIGTGQLRMIGVNLQTLDAEIVMESPNARVWSDEGVTDALAGMTAIGSAGAFEIRGGRNYTRTGNLTNSGQIRIGTGTDLTVSGRLRQIIDAAICSVEGTLTSPDTLRFDRGFVRGNGRIIGNVHNQGTVQPGASIGHLTIQGNYRQRTNGTASFELGGTATGASDLLEITGAADLGGTISLRVAGGYQPHDGDTIEIMRFASRTGNFAQLDVCPAPGVCAELLWSATNLRVVLHVLPTADIQEPETPQDPDQPGSDETIGGEAAPLPTEFAIRATTAVEGGARLELALPAAADGELVLFDVTGRRLHVLDRGPWKPGVQSYRWFGELENGGRAPRGIYFARAEIMTGHGVLDRHTRFVLLGR